MRDENIIRTVPSPIYPNATVHPVPRIGSYGVDAFSQPEIPLSRRRKSIKTRGVESKLLRCVPKKEKKREEEEQIK